jgi:hypothetical protein
MESAGISLPAFAGVQGCPFQGPFYQLMRQFLLAAYLRQTGEADEMKVVSIGFARNTVLHKVPLQLRPLVGGQRSGIIEAWNTVLQGVPPLRRWTVEQLMARANKIEWVDLAGDLFEKRTVDPLAMRVAIEGLRILRQAGIPVVAVEGNHEKAHYRNRYSWLDFLDGLGYLYLLNPRFENGHAVLEPYGDTGGAFVDLPGGVRVYGIKYYGASTSRVSTLFADALSAMDHGDVAFAILVAHAGLEGQLPRYSGTLTYNDLAPLKQHIDYLAPGHIHKPYAVDG